MMNLLPARVQASRVDPTSRTPRFSDSQPGLTDPGDKGFLGSHFGNPESNEVYGSGNDYETEPEQIRDEKASAGQAIWYLGAFVLILALGVWLFGYR